MRSRAGLWAAVLLVGLSGVWAARAQDIEYEGYLDNNVQSKSFSIVLNAGDSVLVTAEATSGDLDTVLTLTNPSGIVVVENDDRADNTLDSAIGYTAPQSGTYTVTVSRYSGSETSGHFVVTIRTGDVSLFDQLEAITRIQLSGSMLVRDSEHFRIHYTLQGVDATSEAMVNALALSVEEIWRIQIEDMGWMPPPQDAVRGGDSRYDVYLADLIGAGESALGYTAPEDFIGDNPNTPNLVENAATSYIVIENDFDVPMFDDTTAISLMRTTMSHEFHHAVQFGYAVSDSDSMRWYYEASATWMETAALSKDEDATGYVEAVFKYPELCFGTDTETNSGSMVYGDWLFIQTLVDTYGQEAVKSLWEHIALYSGFRPLEEMLANYSDTIQNRVEQYHVQNLVRAYSLAPAFHATVWLENTISDIGRWTYTGDGVQELAANYFAVTLTPGMYYAGLVNDGGALSLWAVGIKDSAADAIRLGRGGNINTTDYDYLYLMVFNPFYDDDVSDCAYYDYSIDISRAKGDLMPVERTWDATHFEPLS